MLVLLLLLIVSCTLAYRSGFAPRASFRLNLFGNAPEPNKSQPQKKDGGNFSYQSIHSLHITFIYLFFNLILYIGMFGGMGNIMESMKKAQEIAKQAEVVNKELMETTILGQDPTGQVVASFNGLGVPLQIKISDSIMSQGAGVVSQATTQAMQDAHAKAAQTMVNRMQALYGGVLPPKP